MGPIVRITRSQLKNIIREAQANVTKQYDDDSALKGNQSELPDGLQKAIIDKTVKDREEAEEEKQELLEYERHVDKDGNVYDDEGNVERRGSSFGRRYGGETYAGTSAPWDNKQNTPNVSSASSANTNLQKAIEISLASKPSNFLESILDQILAGKTLSNKQIVIVKKILVKQDPTTSNLFKENKMKVTKRQLRRIIKEEKTKLVTETKVRRLVRRKLRENAPGQAVGVRIEADGSNTGVTPLDAAGQQVGPKVGWEDWDMNLAKPETIAAMKEVYVKYRQLPVTDDPDGLYMEGEPLIDWLWNYIDEAFGDGDTPGTFEELKAQITS